MFKRNKLNAAIVSAMAATGSTVPAHAAIEEVVVTATKTEASAQDIPVAVQALDQTALNDLGITDFTDYLIQMPGITAGGTGPGQNQIYIRGVASTTPNLTTAGVAGLAPNVALYLDEQPLAQPGRNLDVYTADMSRVEVLAGPQGTLFGASSQAGTVRLITNKPDPTGTYAKVRLGTEYTPEGEPSNNVEGVFNLPVNERLTVRGVVYTDNQGGWVDNVRGTRTAAESARFRPQGTERANGVPVSEQREGFQAGSDLTGVNFLEADNATRTEDDFNETTYAGGRLSALWDINAKWSLLVTHMRQTMDSEGVFFADPELDDYEIQRFEDDSIEDGFHNTSWTLDGLVGDLQLLYTGAFTDRNTDQTVDYSDYLFVGQYLPYYICDGSVTYPGGAPSGTCQPPNLFVKSNTNTEVQTHEFRVTTPQDRRIRATAGVFYSDLELRERNDFTYPGSTRAVAFDGETTGFAPNLPFQTGYRSAPGPFPDGVIFRNDVKRTDEQLGAFGEVTFDLGDQVDLTLGGRWYDIEVDFEGSANSSFLNLGGTTVADDCQAFGTDISDLYNGDGEFTFRGQCVPQPTFSLDDSLADIEAAGLSPAQAQQVFNAVRAPDTASTSGFIGKVSLSWQPNDTTLLYATWSEGFRPGLLNRPGGAPGPNDFTVPFELDTDEVVNYELGWKLDLLDRTLRFNGNLFRVDISDLQTTIFDPSITNLFFSANAADAEVTGVEGDFIWTPPGVEGLTISGAFSVLDTEITDVLVPTDDVREGDELAYAPQFQGNIRARYQWFLGNGMTAHVTPVLSYSAEAFSDVVTINRAEVDSWALVDLRAGIAEGNWTAELYAENLLDEQAELQNNFVFDRQRVIYARPRTYGLRVSFDF